MTSTDADNRLRPACRSIVSLGRLDGDDLAELEIAGDVGSAMTEAVAAMFSLSSKSRLTDYDIDRFARGTLFDRLARAVCRAGCLPRKELYEAWEVARRIRRRLRGGRVVDVAGGHGLLAHALLLLDNTSASAVVAGPSIPPSARGLHAAIVADWPRLAGRIAFESRSIDTIELGAGDLVVSSHACGALTDRVIERAVETRARVEFCRAVMTRRPAMQALPPAGSRPTSPST
jgi:hypothetical protein